MKIKTTTLTIRLDEELKEKASKILEAIGTDLSGGIKLFLSNVVTEGSLGFTPMDKDGLKFKYFREYKRKLARAASSWEEIGS